MIRWLLPMALACSAPASDRDQVQGILAQAPGSVARGAPRQAPGRLVVSLPDRDWEIPVGQGVRPRLEGDQVVLGWRASEGLAARRYLVGPAGPFEVTEVAPGATATVRWPPEATALVFLVAGDGDIDALVPIVGDGRGWGGDELRSARLVAFDLGDR